MTYATYEQLTSNSAIVEVNYATGGFGMERVSVKPGRSLYEACYSVASIKCLHQGLRLDRFSKA